MLTTTDEMRRTEWTGGRTGGRAGGWADEQTRLGTLGRRADRRTGASKSADGQTGGRVGGLADWRMTDF